MCCGGESEVAGMCWLVLGWRGHCNVVWGDAVAHEMNGKFKDLPQIITYVSFNGNSRMLEFGDHLWRSTHGIQGTYVVMHKI